jgi:hypothetical protein
MTNIEEARLIGTKMKARTVTMWESLVSIFGFLLKKFGGWRLTRDGVPGILNTGGPKKVLECLFELCLLG